MSFIDNYFVWDYNQNYLNELGFREDDCMSIEEKIKHTISQIDKAIEQECIFSQWELFDRIVEGYRIEFPLLSKGLVQEGTEDGYYRNYERNLRVIKDRLELYLSRYKDEQVHDFKELNQSQIPVNVNVNNTNTSSSDNHSTNKNSNANTANIDLKVMFEQARKTIDDDESLNDIEVSEIIERINQLEELASSDENKRSKWNKCKEVMTWLFEKGAKVAGTILPLITEIIK